MSINLRNTEDSALVATIQTVNGTGSYYSDAIPLQADYGRRFLAVVNVGTIGSSGTVDFGFQWSATVSGTYASITGAAITQDTAGTLTHLIEVSTEQVLAAYPLATYMKGYLKTLVAATPTGVTVRSTDAAHKPITNTATYTGQVVNGLS
jgi:hypothetical protein